MSDDPKKERIVIQGGPHDGEEFVVTPGIERFRIPHRVPGTKIVLIEYQRRPGTNIFE